MHDPEHVWIAVLAAASVAVFCLVVGLLGVWFLLRQFLGRHDAIVKRHEELFEKMRLQQDSSDEALRIQRGLIDSVRGRAAKIEEWKADVVRVLENHEQRMKRLEGR
jgi:hypothetical protein